MKEQESFQKQTVILKHRVTSTNMYMAQPDNGAGTHAPPTRNVLKGQDIIGYGGRGGGEG